MFEVRTAADVAAPPEAVWRVLADPGRYAELSATIHRMIEVPAGDLGVGYRYRAYGGLRPFEGESVWVVTEYEPGRRQVHVGTDGSVRTDLALDLTPVDGGTRLVRTVDMTPRSHLLVPTAMIWFAMLRRRTRAAAETTTADIARAAEAAF